jgi:para-nitrobenzyl esterase
MRSTASSSLSSTSLLVAAALLTACGGNPSTSTSTGGGTAGSSTGGAAGSGGTASGSGGGGTGGTGCGAGVQPQAGTVITTSGAVSGTKAGSTWVFKGIPYAEPPVGDLRWKRPVKHACWDGVRAATDFGAKCVQVDASNNVIGSEDCLTVNVWVPADATPDKPVPVLFFVHGGGNVQGASSVDVNGTVLYDGQALSELGHVAVVTFNYRLGPFGFLSHPAFAEDNPTATGNYGALDQVAALRWAKDNLPAFGGDPSKLLLFGESAGGLDTCILLTSPLAKSLFSAALIESGGCVAQTKDAAESIAKDWATKAGCDKDPDPAACMRKLPAMAVQTLVPAPIDLAGKQGPFQPAVDGYLLTDQPFTVLSTGAHNHVPLAMGNNENETGAAVPTMTEAQYEAAVNALLPSVASQVLAEYKAADYPTPRDAYVALTSDAKFVCPTRRTLRAAAAAQKEPVYRYQFTHVLDNVGAAQKEKGSFHGLELFFVFGQLGVAGYKPSAAEKTLSAAIQGYWSRFGATGDPNGAGAAVKWPVFDPKTDTYLQLDDTISAGAGVHTDKCDFWDSLLP